MAGTSGTGLTGTTYRVVFLGEIGELLVGVFDDPPAADPQTVIDADQGDALSDVLDRLRAGSRASGTSWAAGRRSRLSAP
jgi:hypothetical protein